MAEVTLTTDHAAQRSLVRLRVWMGDIDRAGAALGLPTEPLTSRAGDPSVLWIGPDQWLYLSETVPAPQLIEQVDRILPNVIHVATDVSDALACFLVEGPAARALLAMASGVDFDETAFAAGRCVRTKFARMAVVIHAAAPDRFELFLDRSGADYLEQWLRRAIKDATA
jgi:Sarcosine oxidase gamma subunit